MRDTHFDLLVLDIALPLRMDQEVQRDGGLVLLDEVLARDTYKVPTHIIGFTGYTDVFANAFERFSRQLLTLVFFDPGTDEWIPRLQARLRHILAAAAEQGKERPQPSTHLSVVCALESPELEAVLRLPGLGIRFTFHWMTQFTIKDHLRVEVLNGLFTRLLRRAWGCPPLPHWP